MTVGPDFIKNYNVQLIAGRGYQSIADTNSVLINEEALGMFGYHSVQEALRSDLYFTGLDTLRIIGVVANYFQETLREPIKPTAYLLAPNDLKYLTIATSSGNGLPDTDELFSAYFPNQTVEPILLKELMEGRHHDETVFLRVFNLFTFLAVLLSIVGIVGLVSYTITRKEKEIAIRKVLGSGARRLVWRIMSEFLGLVLLANVLLFPLAYFFGREWLQGFAYHTSFNWSFPILSLLLGGILVVLFASSHVWKVVRRNPCSTLYKE